MPLGCVLNKVGWVCGPADNHQVDFVEQLQKRTTPLSWIHSSASTHTSSSCRLVALYIYMWEEELVFGKNGISLMSRKLSPHVPPSPTLFLHSFLTLSFSKVFSFVNGQKSLGPFGVGSNTGVTKEWCVGGSMVGVVVSAVVLLGSLHHISLPVWLKLLHRCLGCVCQMRVMGWWLYKC